MLGCGLFTRACRAGTWDSALRTGSTTPNGKRKFASSQPGTEGLHSCYALPMPTRRLWTVIAAALFASSLLAQENVPPHRAGDSSLVAATYATTRIIYDSSSAPVFSFTRTNVLGIIGATATELQGSFFKGRVSRVVAGTWGSAGQYAIEYYFTNDSLIFSFESFQYVVEAAPLAQWRNFRGLPAWERRIFWKGEDAAFVETRGISTELTLRDRERLHRLGDRLRELVRLRAAETLPMPRP